MKLSAVTFLLTSLSSVSAFTPTSTRTTSTATNIGPATRTSILSLNAAARKPFISGNWKLNPSTKGEAVALAKDISSKITDSSPDCDVALFVPYVFIEAAMEAAADSKIMVGAEGVCPELKGAFTGAVSTSMLDSVGVKWVLAGHSERRVIFGESDEYINGQCRQLIAGGLNVMLCVGESETEYDQNLAGAVCAVQLKKGLANISKDDMERVAIAYEPVWAIGTGKVATPEVAQSVHSKIRAILAEMYDQDTADSVRILYGGSVTPDSVDDLMAQPDIDGALVGGASLDAAKFGRIINFESK